MAARTAGRKGRPTLRLFRALAACARLCAICGAELRHDLHHNHPLYPTVDHIVPLSRGGAPLDPRNLRVVHRSCNSAKGARTAVEPPRRNSRAW